MAIDTADRAKSPDGESGWNFRTKVKTALLAVITPVMILTACGEAGPSTAVVGVGANPGAMNDAGTPVTVVAGKMPKPVDAPVVVEPTVTAQPDTPTPQPRETEVIETSDVVTGTIRAETAKPVAVVEVPIDELGPSATSNATATQSAGETTTVEFEQSAGGGTGGNNPETEAEGTPGLGIDQGGMKDIIIDTTEDIVFNDSAPDILSKFIHDEVLGVDQKGLNSDSFLARAFAEGLSEQTQVQFKLASGESVLIQDSDDQFSGGFVEVLMSGISSTARIQYDKEQNVLVVECVGDVYSDQDPTDEAANYIGFIVAALQDGLPEGKYVGDYADGKEVLILKGTGNITYDVGHAVYGLMVRYTDSEDPWHRMFEGQLRMPQS